MFALPLLELRQPRELLLPLLAMSEKLHMKNQHARECLLNLRCDSGLYTDIISYYDGMGPALYRLCEFNSALDFFNESLLNNPDDVEILVNKGSALGKLGYFEESLAYYDHAIAIDPDFLPAKNNKANSLANLGNFDDAISLYTEILEENPDYNTARKNLATALSLKPSIESMDDLQEKSEDETFPKESLSEKTIPKNEKQSSTNFFEEFSKVFSSLFGFLN